VSDAQQQGHLPAQKANDGRARHRFLVMLLVAVGSAAVAGGAIAIWLRTTALESDSFVETVAPLTQDPEVANALATLVVNEVFEDVDVDARVRAALPDALGFLAAPVASGVEDLAVDIAEEIITSDAFVGLWSTATRLAHSSAVAVLTGRETILVGAEGQVVLDLGDTASAVRAALDDAGLGELLPPPRQDGAAVILFTDGEAGILKVTVDILDVTYFALPILALVALGTAIWLSRERRRTVLAAAIGVCIAAAVGLLVVDLARGHTLSMVENESFLPAVASTWDILFRNLVGIYVGLLVVAALVAAVTWLGGPHPWAVAVRGTVSQRLPNGDRSDRLSAFVDEHRGPLRLVGAFVVLASLFLWPRLTVWVVVGAGLILAAYLSLIERTRARADGRSEAPRT